MTVKNSSAAYCLAVQYDVKVISRIISLCCGLIYTHAYVILKKGVLGQLNCNFIFLQDLHDRVMDFIVPHFNNMVKTEEYQSMVAELQKRLILEMAAENVFDDLKRKSKK